MMPNKVTPKLREQAAIYCSAKAAWWAAEKRVPRPYLAKFPKRVKNLAYAAFTHASTTMPTEWYPSLWGEAHALLMTGWEP